MQLSTPNIEIQKCPLELFEYLKDTFIFNTDWDNDDLLAKEEAFFDQAYRYEAITKYFNEESFFFSKLPPTADVTNKIKPYTDYLINNLFPGYILFRCQISFLKPGQNVHPHIDPRYYHKYGKRIHLPLIINPGSFHVHFLPNQNYEMKFSRMTEGMITDFDNITPHSAFNYGTTNRIHIICDIIKEEIIKKIEDACNGNPNASHQKYIDEYYMHLKKIEEQYQCDHKNLKAHYLQNMPKE